MALEIPSLAPDENFVFACGLARNYKTYYFVFEKPIRK